MCGPRERYGEYSFGGGVTLPAGAVVGAGVASAGFVATVRLPQDANLVFRRIPFAFHRLVLSCGPD